MHMKARTALIASATLTLVTLTAPAATAATPPPNDNIANATVISALPYTVDENIAGATKESGEPRPSCDRGTRGTAWWTITPSSSGWLVADTHGSQIRTVAAVYTGTPGALTRVACNDDTYRNGRFSAKARVYWNATAGTQYYVQVAKDYGRGGLLHLKVDNSPPPFSVAAVTVDGGTVDGQTGTAVLRGTAVCTSGPGTVWLDLTVRQQIGRFYINDEGSKRFSCDGTTSWQLKLSSSDGAFTGGPIDVTGRAYWRDGNGGRIRLAPTTVRLTG
jgi:hypothetical protein